MSVKEAKVCQWCDRSISAMRRADTIYCSDTCRQHGYWARELTRIRQQLEAAKQLPRSKAPDLGPLSRRQRELNLRLRMLPPFRHALGTARCARCDEFFDFGRRDKLYCSTRCRVAAHRSRQRGFPVGTWSTP